MDLTSWSHLESVCLCLVLFYVCVCVCVFGTILVYDRQDNLFSEEISRNPDFAHLARGSNNTRGTAARSGRSSTTNRISMARPPSSSQPAPDLDIIKSLGELGNSARRRLQVLAAQFHAKTRPNHQQGGTAAASANTSTTAERRGLLNDDTMDDDVALEFATRKDD